MNERFAFSLCFFFFFCSWLSDKQALPTSKATFNILDSAKCYPWFCLISFTAQCSFHSTSRGCSLFFLSIGNYSTRDGILLVKSHGTMETSWYPGSQLSRLHQSWFLFQCHQGSRALTFSWPCHNKYGEMVRIHQNKLQSQTEIQTK